MATIVTAGKIKLDNGQIITPQQGGWYDSQQYWNGSLSTPGVINAQSNQQGAGQAVSKEVIAQTNPANVQYVQQQQQKAAATPQPAPTQPVAQPGTPSLPGGSGAGAGMGIAPPATINLPNLYKTLYDTSGISGLEGDLSKKVEDYNKTRAAIADNPYLSEATLTGRLKKLSDAFDSNIANVKNDIATKKADIETRLNLETKQFDINSQAAQQALQQFNTLLSMGALDGASGEDIANLTRSTGLSSAAIQSAISATKDKNVKASVHYSTSDDGTVTAVTINENTGDIIKQVSLGKIGNAQTGGTAGTKAQELEANRANLITSIKNYNDLSAIVGAFQGVMDVDEIYRLYNLYSPFGTAKESLNQVKQGVFSTAPGFKKDI